MDAVGLGGLSLPATRGTLPLSRMESRSSTSHLCKECAANARSTARRHRPILVSPPIVRTNEASPVVNRAGSEELPRMSLSPLTRDGRRVRYAAAALGRGDARKPAGSRRKSPHRSPVAAGPGASGPRPLSTRHRLWLSRGSLSPKRTRRRTLEQHPERRQADHPRVSAVASTFIVRSQSFIE